MVRGTKAGEGDLHEEINLGEAHTRGLVPGAPISPIDDLINTAREQAGFRSSPPAGPGERPVPTFVTAEVDVFLGEPLYAGNILQLTLGESIHEMQLVLFANGFSLAPCDSTAPGSPRTVARAWSPFSLVEKCQVKTMQHSAFWAVFKLTFFRRGGQDRCYYFATTGNDAYKERDRWVQEMVGAIGMVTMSLFPGRAITVQPLPDVAATSSRIMAGYLLQNGMADNVSLLYCELQAYAHGKARLAVYSDEWCVQEVSSVSLADSSTISTRKGDYCPVFGIDNHRFCARTREEKDLWVRAVSNVKVKLMFDAPEPTREELQVFRAAVHERIGEIKTATPENSAAPLLSRAPRLPPLSPRGDAWDPEPMEDTTSDPPVIQGDDNCSIEDIDEAGGPWTDISPPCTDTPYCASPKAMAGDVVAFSTPLAEMPPDTEADHSEVVAVEAQDSPQPVTRVVPKVDTGSARGDHGAHGLAFGPPHLCYAGCLTPADELRTTLGINVRSTCAPSSSRRWGLHAWSWALRLSFIVVAVPGAHGRRAASTLSSPKLAAEAWAQPANPAPAGHWAPLASTAPETIYEKRRAAFLTFRNELQTRLSRKRDLMHSQMVIHESQWHATGMSAGASFKLGLSVFSGFVLVGVLMKLGIFVD